MHTHTIIITIGRNVGGKPMNTVRWQKFKSDILGALASHEATLLQQPQMGNMRAHDQIGWWEGKQEAAATFVAFIHRRELANLRRWLSGLAEYYDQDAIGFIAAVGTDHLVTRHG